MKTSTVAWIIIVLILLGAGWYFFSNRSTTLSPTQNIAIENSQNPAAPSPETAGASMSASVAYGPDGFSPSTVTVAKGGVVTFKNGGTGKMWVAADMHPTHEGYDGTTKDQHCPDAAGVAFDQCSVGPAYSFTFEKTGEWQYHNHVNAGDVGTVIVK